MAAGVLFAIGEAACGGLTDKKARFLFLSWPQPSPAFGQVEARGVVDLPFAHLSGAIARCRVPTLRGWLSLANWSTFWALAGAQQLRAGYRYNPAIAQLR